MWFGFDLLKFLEIDHSMYKLKIYHDWYKTWLKKEHCHYNQNFPLMLKIYCTGQFAINIFEYNA